MTETDRENVVLIVICRLTACLFCPPLQRWDHLTKPVWGAHQLEYMAPDTDIKSLASLSPGTEENKVIIFESVM